MNEHSASSKSRTLRRNLQRGWSLFTADAARWVRPQQIASRDEVTPLVVCQLLFRHRELRAVAWFRLGSALQSAGVRGLPHWTQRRIHRLYGLELPVGSEVGGGFYVAHSVGSVIVAESIGENVTVISQVTLGANKVARWPTIDDRVFIGAGARVLGGIHIGHDAKVGANAVVLTDVAPNTTVVGIPARDAGIA